MQHRGHNLSPPPFKTSCCRCMQTSSPHTNKVSQGKMQYMHIFSDRLLSQCRAVLEQIPYKTFSYLMLHQFFQYIALEWHFIYRLWKKRSRKVEWTSVGFELADSRQILQVIPVQRSYDSWTIFPLFAPLEFEIFTHTQLLMFNSSLLYVVYW